MDERCQQRVECMPTRVAEAPTWRRPRVIRATSSRRGFAEETVADREPLRMPRTPRPCCDIVDQIAGPGSRQHHRPIRRITRRMRASLIPPRANLGGRQRSTVTRDSPDRDGNAPVPGVSTI